MKKKIFSLDPLQYNIKNFSLLNVIFDLELTKKEIFVLSHINMLNKDKLTKDDEKDLIKKTLVSKQNIKLYLDSLKKKKALYKNGGINKTLKIDESNSKYYLIIENENIK